MSQPCIETLDDIVYSISVIENEIMHYMYNKYFKEVLPYNEFKKTIFGLKRKRIVQQYDLLGEDITDLEKADEEFAVRGNGDISLKNYRSKYGYPNHLRCHHIINRNNNLVRCKNKIIDGDDRYDTCSEHNSEANVYYDEYCRLIEEYKKKIEDTNDC